MLHNDAPGILRLPILPVTFLVGRIRATMSGKGHKRKRSIQDTPVDLNKMKMALNHLSSLKEELDGIQETEGEMEAVMEHVHALQKILETAKKRVGEALCLSDTGLSS